MYKIAYYLPGQSTLFSHPLVFTTRNEEEYKQALKIAFVNGYTIVYEGYAEDK